jgi:hypothetical protein
MWNTETQYEGKTKKFFHVKQVWYIIILLLWNWRTGCLSPAGCEFAHRYYRYLVVVWNFPNMGSVITIADTRIVACRLAAGQRPRNKQIYKSRCWNGFANKHVPTEKTELQKWRAVFATRSVPRCFNHDIIWELTTGAMSKLWDIRQLVRSLAEDIVRISYQETTSEEIEDIICDADTVIFRVCKPVRLLQLLVVTCYMYKWSINPITNPNPVYNYSYMWQYEFLRNVNLKSWLSVHFQVVSWHLPAVVLVVTQKHFLPNATVQSPAL